MVCEMGVYVDSTLKKIFCLIIIMGLTHNDEHFCLTGKKKFNFDVENPCKIWNYYFI